MILSAPSRRTLLRFGAGTALAASLATPRPSAAQAPSTPAAVPAPGSAPLARDAVAALRDTILRISHEVWDTPELSLHEEASSAIHLRELRQAGFAIVSTGTSGIPTAFVAEWSQGQGGPKIGFLPEYDALPGLGNAAEPRRAPGPAGTAVGHGCGHNMLGAACTGAAMALRRLMLDGGHPGTVRVYGCAAEETEGAKVFMARDGLFSDLDAALAWHPAPVTGTGLLRTAAVDVLRLRFHGRSAHAGVDPWEGRSALKGAEMFGVGVQFMREHLRPTARLHYVFTDAGLAPNVVPDHAAVVIHVRDADRPKVEDTTAWVAQVAEGAAMATQTRVEVDHVFAMHDLLPNAPLVSRIHRHLAAVPIAWTEQEQAFARACQRETKLSESGLSTTLLPILPEIQTGGATDVGDVSYSAPCALFAWVTMPAGVGLHTWPVTACARMSIGDKASLNAATVMAGVGYDLVTDPALRAEVRADFQQRTGGRPYVSPLPPGRLRPEGIPPHLLIRDGMGELTDEFYELAKP